MPDSKDDIEQRLVDKRFDERCSYWNGIYQQKDMHAIIYQRRMAVALNYIAELSLPEGARVLEIGCGAGFVSVSLARRGFLVQSVDHAPSMIALTLRHASEAGVEKRVHATIEDARNLSFDDSSFDLIVALGVVPWLHDLRKALFEVTRVLVPCGYAVLNMDNRYRLNAWVDLPTFLRRKVVDMLERVGLRDPIPPHAHSRSHSIKEFNDLLNEADMTRVKAASIGFGPFRLFNHSILSDPVGIKIHQKLQKHADKGHPILGSSGSQYVVLARKRK